MSLLTMENEDDYAQYEFYTLLPIKICKENHRIRNENHISTDSSNILKLNCRSLGNIS